MKRLLKEPLLHFLLLGGLIFAAYGWLNRDEPRGDEIIVTLGQQEHLVNIFTRTWQRPPTATEFDGLIQDYIRQEIAYREGQAMGLDQEDTVIRRRVRQKLELLADEVISLSAPGDNDLQEYLEAHAQQFMLEPRLDLKQVYVSRDRRGSNAEMDARAILDILRTDGSIDWATVGDPLPLGNSFDDVSLDQLERSFGTGFAQQILEADRATWTGPVESGFGLHLVFVEDFVPAMLPELDQVRQRVENEWFASRREEAINRLYERLAEKYTIEIESPGPGG